MKLVSALVGLAALGGVALSSVAASAMPVAVARQIAPAPHVEQTAYVCNRWGHCWDQPDDGFYHPHDWGGWGWHRGWGWHHWHPHYWGGWGWHRPWAFGWHHWHPHYWGGWGWHRGWGYGWHHWHHWQQW
jgi:hypothetical protein